MDGNTNELNRLASNAFSGMHFETIEIVEAERLLDWDKDEFNDKPCMHGVGVFYAVDIENSDADSEKFSFHCLIQEVEGELKVVSAYAYDVKSGNEIATLEVAE